MVGVGLSRTAPVVGLTACLMIFQLGISSGQTQAPVLMEADFETGYSGLDLAPLTDGVDSTCLDFKPIWTFLPVVSFRRDWNTGNTFSVRVHLGPVVEELRTNVLRVIASKDGVQTGDYFPAAETYTKCEVSSVAGQFDCTCTAPCSYYVQIVFGVFDDVASLSAVELCDISTV